MILDDSRKRIERTKDNELENAFKDYGDEQTNNERTSKKNTVHTREVKCKETRNAKEFKQGLV